MSFSRRHVDRYPGWWFVTLLVFWPVSASAAEENERPTGTVLIDISPEPPVAAWIASALEQNVTREILAYPHIQVVDKRDVDTGVCEAADTDCRLGEYGEAGIDIVMTGTLDADGLRYEIFECWTPSRVTNGSLGLGLGTGMVRLKQRILRAAAPFLKRGGLLDEKPSFALRRLLPRRTSEATDPAPEDPQRLRVVGAVCAATAAFFAIPALLVVFSIGRKKAPRKNRLRSLRWTFPLVICAGVLAVHCWTDWLTDLWARLDPGSTAGGFLQTLWAQASSWEWLIAIVGGLSWGAFVLLTLRTAFLPIGGMDRIGHRDVARLLKAWIVVCAQRVALLVVFYTPFALLFWWLISWWPAYLHFALILLAPLGGLMLRAWFLALVESGSAYLDDRLVDGPATRDNPWHRDVKKYFQGYLNRSGWSVESKLLDRVLFLPGKIDGSLCYGGGTTHPRVLISTKLLHVAIGAPEEVPPESRFVPWSNWLAAAVLPQNQANPTASRSPRIVGPFAALGRVLGVLFRPIFRRSAKRRRVRPRRSSRRKTLGQAATSLGYTVPFPPEELVPLIADGTEDFEIVRELLAEHYAWFEPDPDDESDDTDPTDRDFLFGVLVREIGQIQRQQSQLLTLLKGVELWSHGRPWLRKLEGMTVEVYQRLFSRAPAVLADGYAALNLARHHLIQYLYYVGWNQDDLLTERADGPELHRLSKEIFARVGAMEPDSRDQQHRRATIRNRLIWLSQFFHSGLAVPRKHWVRVLAGVFVSMAAVAGMAFLVRQAVDYHPTYIQRIAEQKRKIEESKRKSMRDDKRHTRHGQKR